MQSPLFLDTLTATPQDRRRIEALLAVSSDAFFEIELATGTIRWSRGIQLLLGHDPLRVGERLERWRELIHPEDAPSVVQAWKDLVLAVDRMWAAELRVARADGSYAPCRVRATVVADDLRRPALVVGALADVAPLLELEGELRAVSAQLREELARERLEHVRAELLMRAAVSDALGEWDLATDLLTWSPNVASVLGYEPSELRSISDWAAKTAGDDGARAVREVRGVLSGGATRWHGRVRWILPSSEVVPIEIEGYVLAGSDGRPARMVGSARRIPIAQQPVAHPRHDLSPRQGQVLRLVRLGYSNKEIGWHLGISEHAAKMHVAKLMRKLGVHTRATLAVIAREAELAADHDKSREIAT